MYLSSAVYIFSSVCSFNGAIVLWNHYCMVRRRTLSRFAAFAHSTVGTVIGLRLIGVTCQFLNHSAGQLSNYAPLKLDKSSRNHFQIVASTRDLLLNYSVMCWFRVLNRIPKKVENALIKVGVLVCATEYCLYRHVLNKYFKILKMKKKCLFFFFVTFYMNFNTKSAFIFSNKKDDIHYYYYPLLEQQIE